MKKSLLLLITLFLTAIPGSTNDSVIPKLTKNNLVYYSHKKPVLIYLSLGCDMGSHASKQFVDNMKTIKGVYFAVVDINSSYKIFSTSLKTSLGAMLIAHKSKIIASSIHDSKFLFGYNQKYNWAVKRLKQLGVKISYQTLDNDRITPDYSSSSINLQKGLIAKFLFNGNVNDSSGNKTAFKLNSKSKLLSGKLSIDGSTWKGVRRSKAVSYKMGTTTKPFTVCLNFKQTEGSFLNKNVLFEIRNRFITVFNHKGKLLVTIDASGLKPGESKWKYYDEFYAFEETNISYNSWHNIIFVWNPEVRKIAVMLDGIRLKDLKISTKLKKFFSQFNDSITGVTFGRGGAPYGFYGTIDNLIIYNRALNQKEMKALYKKYGP